MPSKTSKKPVVKATAKSATKPAASPAKKGTAPAKKPIKSLLVDKTKKATTPVKPLKAAAKSAKPAPPPKKAPLVPTNKIAETKPVVVDVAVKKKPGRPAKAVADSDAAGGAKRGRKPKSAADGDEDLSDVVAEFEEAPVVDATEKVKPLRMKISKAKERALMKEFGLDETVLSEEDILKRRMRLKALIKLGKTRGYLTHGEISDHLPDKLIDAETLEAVILTLNDLGVAVYEQTPDAESLLITSNAPAGSTEEEAEEAAEAALSTVDSEFGRTTDPVRMYMREMGTVELLTREGEIEIAKRIEGGLMRMM
ncbi:MAG: RNA polymerase sigma factor RpoD, partial [Polaromonas sp.]|nr:RNA polymerase sigma factor RpoD [Polaromonas sp.]